MEKIENLHPFESTDQVVHSKMKINVMLDITQQSLKSITRKSYHKKNDIFGDGTGFSTFKIHEHIAHIVTSKNNWHDGAVCSHILSLLMNKGYR